MIYVTSDSLDIMNHKNIMIPISCDGILYGTSKFLLNSRSKVKDYLRTLFTTNSLKQNQYYNFQYTKNISFFFLTVKNEYIDIPNKDEIYKVLKNIIKIIDTYDLDEIHMPFIGSNIGRSNDFLPNYYDHINTLKDIKTKIHIHLPIYSMNSYMIVI